MDFVDVERVFNFMDTNCDQTISVNEFCLLVEGSQLSMKERLQTGFSRDFEEKLKAEISELFDKLDENKDRSLTAQELVQIFRP